MERRDGKEWVNETKENRPSGNPLVYKPIIMYRPFIVYRQIIQYTHIHTYMYTHMHAHTISL